MDLLDRLLAPDHWATARLDQPFDIGHRTLGATSEHMISNVEFWAY